MFEPHKVAYRHPKYKTAYRVKNWPEYEKSLRDRGDITVWFSQDAIEAWTAAPLSARVKLVRSQLPGLAHHRC